MSYKSTSLLAVKGAKYNQRAGEDIRDKIPERVVTSANNVNGHYNNFFIAQQNAAAMKAASPMHHHQQQQQMQSPSSSSKPAPAPAPSTTLVEKPVGQQPPSQMKTLASEKYWKMDENGSHTDGDVVIIHVCDENQQISKDFCCKRDILVKHMKYFEKFLAENENGYDDIDISVHCDVEIFEWLMTYIHEPDSPPKIEKTIIVSILISSEFLQMDALVDLCIQHVAGNLSEIIKLPIDLSCISERLVNRIAFITQPKTLSETKDRKDKILTKLYKRRVELDFSRKGSSAPRSGSFSGNAMTAPPPATSTRTIAASLTCCRHCGLVYLDNYVSFLTCRASPPTVDFRGQLASRHSAIVGWSLTSYLKTLHSGGMGWDAIYWHVWAACVVFRVENVMISALEVDRYTVEPDGLFIRNSIPKEEGATDASSVEGMGGAGASAGTSAGTGGQTVSPPGSGSGSGTGSGANSPLPPRPSPVFSLSVEDDCRGNAPDAKAYKLSVCKRPDAFPANPSITSSLNPARPPDILTPEIFDLVCTQMKYIVGLSHKILIQKTMKAAVDSARAVLPLRAVDFGELFWRNPPRTSTYEGSVIAVEVPSATTPAALERRRGRSPGRNARVSPAESRKYSQSLPKSGGRTTMVGGIASKQATVSTPTAATTDSGNASNDSDQDTPGRPPAGGSERRSRSSSTGARLSSLATGTAGSSKNLKRLALAPVTTSDDLSVEDDGPVGIRLNQAYIDPAAAKQIAVLQSLPPEIQVRIFQTKGPVYGQWMVAHPLQVRASLHREMMRTVEDSSIIASKKLEWQLDILREWDEKRMELYERFLVSRRNRPAEPVEMRRPNKKTNKPTVEYYKDRGRQAWNR